MSTATVPNTSPTDHILVIRLSAMGDVAMTIPVLRILRATYPDLQITVLTKQFFAPIFESIENVRVVHAAVQEQHKGVLGLHRLYKELRVLGITQVADLHNVLRSKVLNTFFKYYGTKVAKIDKGRAAKKALTRATKKILKPLKTTHQRYADVFEALGYPIDFSAQVPIVKQTLTPKVLELTKRSAKKWIGIAPFAQYESKTYPLPLMINVIEQLDRQERFEIFLFGGGATEIEALEAIAVKCPSVQNIAGKLSFAEELMIIANLDGMLSMDSGNGHLAAMYGIPTITLWGVTHPFAGFVPFGQPMERSLLPNLEIYDQIPTSIYGNKVPSGYEKVMETIKPDEVVEAINRL